MCPIDYIKPIDLEFYLIENFYSIGQEKDRYDHCIDDGNHDDNRIV